MTRRYINLDFLQAELEQLMAEAKQAKEDAARERQEVTHCEHIL